MVKSEETPDPTLRALLERVLAAAEGTQRSTADTVGEMRKDLKRVEDDVRSLKERALKQDAAAAAIKEHKASARSSWEAVRGWIPLLATVAGLFIWAVASGWRPWM